MPLNASTFVLASLALGIVGFLIGLRYLPMKAEAVGVGLLLVALPYLWLKMAERARNNFV